MFALDKPFTWIVILVIVLLIFGAGKLPDIGKSLGKSIKEFKEETRTGLEGSDGVTTTTTVNSASSLNNTTPLKVEPTVRRRIIKHPDGREEVIEEHVSQS